MRQVRSPIDVFRRRDLPGARWFRWRAAPMNDLKRLGRARAGFHLDWRVGRDERADDAPMAPRSLAPIGHMRMRRCAGVRSAERPPQGHRALAARWVATEGKRNGGGMRLPVEPAWIDSGSPGHCPRLGPTHDATASVAGRGRRVAALSTPWRVVLHCEGRKS